ncbi:hypothetical protein T265_11854 [Opisthorchis viverrini]|uniref:Uncharacterized protein n=1 Tax=Opisthorchis viverrini TaxID=6198 RepID=A0A074ZVY0_OPIVI|nr:hypothetical protein T265_11854 [Opisthorchis viverrini]KER19344.1 hypothetical protein T265_11854 [Opisthorchis viverrini]
MTLLYVVHGVECKFLPSTLTPDPRILDGNLLTGRSVIRTRPLHLDFPCLGLSNLAVPQLSSGGMTVKHRKGATAKRFLFTFD